MATWCVYHLIHVRTPHQYIPKLVIREVPENAEPTLETLERAGFQFGEFGVPWANHVLAKVNAKESPSDLVARLRRYDGLQLTYARLLELAEAEL